MNGARGARTPAVSLSFMMPMIQRAGFFENGEDIQVAANARGLGIVPAVYNERLLPEPDGLEAPAPGNLGEALGPCALRHL